MHGRVADDGRWSRQTRRKGRRTDRMKQQYRATKEQAAKAKAAKESRHGLQSAGHDDG